MSRSYTHVTIDIRCMYVLLQYQLDSVYKIHTHTHTHYSVRVSPAPLDTVSRRAGQRLQLRLLAGSKKTDWRLVVFPSEEEEGERGYVDLSEGGWRERVRRWQLVAAGTKDTTVLLTASCDNTRYLM